MARAPRLTATLLTFCTPAVLALWTSAKSVYATDLGTIEMTVWNNQTDWNWYNSSPPIPPTSVEVGRQMVTTVTRNFDQEPVYGLWDDFQIRYTGNIHTDSDAVVQFIVQADDGTVLNINNQQISYDWWDKGGGGSVSTPVVFEAGVSQPFEVWFYENGGGAWLELWWDYNGEWGPVPASAFTLQPVAPTTTTSSTTSTTTSSITTSTSTTTTTTLPVTTTETATTSTSTTSTEPPTETTTTTTSSVPKSPVSTPPSTTSTTTTTVASSTSYQVNTSIAQPSTTQAAPTSTQPIAVSSSTTTTVPPTAPPTTAPALQQRMDPEQAATLATSPQLVANLTSEQAAVLFSSVDIDQVSDEQASAIVAAVQDAPVAVRAQFESKIDVFSGKTDLYIPLGSTVNVATRRVLVVSVAFTIAAPLPSRRSRI